MEIDNISFIKHLERRDWFVGQIEGDWSELEKKAVEINGGGRARGYFAICGCVPGDAQHRLYLVPDNDPVQLARDFEVGAHGGEEQEAIDELTLIHERNPIVPFFADSAGFKFRFKKPITDEFVSFLEAALSAGGDEQMLDENGELNVRQTGFIHLWWD